MSRLVVLWGAMIYQPDCQAHWSLYLTVIPWSITEGGMREGGSG